MSISLDLRKLLTFRLVALSREISHFNQRTLNPTDDLNIPQLRMLSLHYTLGKTSQSDIIKHTSRVYPGNTSRYMKSLETKRYLKAVRDQKDKRSKWLKLTPKGKKAAERYLQTRYFHNKDLTAGFTQAELKQFDKLLAKATRFYEDQSS